MWWRAGGAQTRWHAVADGHPEYFASDDIHLSGAGLRAFTAALEDAGHFLPLLPKPDRSAAFAVLTAPDVPSVLIEMGYLSNVKDATLLTQIQHRQRLAGILARSIEGYFAWRGVGRKP